MANLSARPSTEELASTAGKELGIRYKVNFQGHDIDLVLLGNRVNIYVAAEDTPVGYMRFGGPGSGAMWKGRDCIAEYSLDDEGKYSVIQIVKGFKSPKSRKRIEPLLFLLTSVVSS